jgi:hypothetical protein
MKLLITGVGGFIGAAIVQRRNRFVGYPRPAGLRPGGNA